MKKDWKYILYLSLVVGIYVVVKLMERKQRDWTVTFAHEDKEPFGTYAFDQLLPSFFKGQPVKNSYRTFYELKDSLQAKSSMILVASSLTADKADTDAMLNYVEGGGTLFMSAQHFYGHFADTLGLATRDNFLSAETPFNKYDSAGIYFTNSHLDSGTVFYYKTDNIHNYFSKLDSVQATVIAKNDEHKPVMLRVAKGKGQLILSCTPMALTNIYLLNKSNNEFASNTLSFFPQAQVYRTEFYHLGRMEASSPLRFILTTEPLKWAYYLTVISILLFMIFEAKRKQRIIPVMLPPSNTSLEFVTTIGNLYYQRGDHANVARKRISFFMDHVRSSYFLTTTQYDDIFTEHLSRKSGYSLEKTKALVAKLRYVITSKEISRSELLDLNRHLESFYKSTK